MKYLQIAIGIAAFVTSVHAEWELGLESVAPTGDFSDIAEGGGGLYANIYQEHNDNLRYNLYVGALSYGGVEGGGLKFQWFGYPVTLGGTYYLSDTDAGGPFIKGNAGLMFKLGTVTFLGEEESESETGSVVSFGGGWAFGKVNIAADYNLGNDNWTWLAIKAAWRFGK